MMLGIPQNEILTVFNGIKRIQQCMRKSRLLHRKLGTVSSAPRYLPCLERILGFYQLPQI